MYRELLIGCGHRKIKFLSKYSPYKTFQNLTTLDINPLCKPNVLHDLNKLPYPFKDGEFDEIHAYEVLEHCGRQGDVNFFFGQFKEFYRVLCKGGVFCGSVPNLTSILLWDDPSHTRAIGELQIHALTKNFYNDLGSPQAGPRADYRYLMGNMDWKIMELFKDEHHMCFTLRKI